MSSVSRWYNEFPLPLYDTGLKVKGWFGLFPTALYEYKAYPCAPCTLQVDKTTFVQPDRHCYLNMGSVPIIFQGIVPKDLHNPSFLLHDCACTFYGLYFSSQLHGVYEYKRLSFKTVHELLKIGLEAAGYPIRSKLVYQAVSMLGPRWTENDIPPGDKAWRAAVVNKSKQKNINIL